MAPLSEARILVVGVARNCARAVRDDVLRIGAALSGAKSVSWFIVESDSTDKTPSTLAGMTVEIPNFTFATLGVLRNQIPLRCPRIAHCRNVYVEAIRTLYRDVDYVVVADLDGINTLIDASAVESCWKRDDWDMCAANQRGPYYDIWSLRHPLWCPGDCWQQQEFLSTYRRDWERLRYATTYSRMITVPPNSEWIEVDGAFGGFAIYRREMFELGDYKGLADNGQEQCDNVGFHAQLREHGARLFINPALVNGGENEHTRFRKWRHSAVRSLKDLAKQVLLKAPALAGRISRA